MFKKQELDEIVSSIPISKEPEFKKGQKVLHLDTWLPMEIVDLEPDGYIIKNSVGEIIKGVKANRLRGYTEAEPMPQDEVDKLLK